MMTKKGKTGANIEETGRQTEKPLGEREGFRRYEQDENAEKELKDTYAQMIAFMIMSHKPPIAEWTSGHRTRRQSRPHSLGS